MISIDWNGLMSSISDEPLAPGLYVCPTPIGNLEDITLRVLRILAQAHVVAAEDTRHSLKLFNHFGISKKLISYHEHNERTRSSELLVRIRQGEAVALISDAGMPGISDPGAEVIRLCIEEGLGVTVLPGPNAALTALVASGLSTEQFGFWGFLERKGKKRSVQIQQLLNFEGTSIFYESPNRLEATLREFGQWGEKRQCVVARELTKRYEEYQRGTLDEVAQYYKETPPKGEVVVLVEGGLLKEEEAVVDWEARIEVLRGEGLSTKDMAKVLAKETGRSKNEVYQQLLNKGK